MGIQAIAVAPGFCPVRRPRQLNTITSPPTAVISTVAGNGTDGYPDTGAGGPATSAKIGTPQAVAVDAAGNIYFSDSNNNVVWMVSAHDGNHLHCGRQWNTRATPGITDRQPAHSWNPSMAWRWTARAISTSPMKMTMLFARLRPARE